MGIFSVNLNSINLQNNLDEDDPDTIFLIRLLAWHIRFKKHISEKLMPIAWHPKRWLNFSMSEDDKKEIEPIFSE